LNAPSEGAVMSTPCAPPSVPFFHGLCRVGRLRVDDEIRAEARRMGELAVVDVHRADLVAYHFHEALGVVAQIIPWNFQLLMAVWKLAPALAAGNAVVLKPAEQTPVSIMAFVELIADLLPPGVLNVVQGFGIEVGKPLASSPRVAKVVFTGATSTGRLIAQYDRPLPVRHVRPDRLPHDGSGVHIERARDGHADHELLG